MFYLAQIGAIYLNRFLGLFSGISKFEENFLISNFNFWWKQKL